MRPSAAQEKWAGSEDDSVCFSPRTIEFSVKFWARCTVISELVGLVVIGLVGRPVGFGLVWSPIVIGLVWFGLDLLVLLVWSKLFWDM